MNNTARARAHRAPLRITLIFTAALSGAGLLLAACSSVSPSAGGTGAGSIRNGPGVREAGPLVHAAASGRSASGVPSVARAARLLQPQSIIFTANLTVRVKDVTAASSQATSLVSAAGGYVSSEQQTIPPGGDGSAEISLELKIPAPLYQATLSKLETTLGRKVSLEAQAQDVTQQVADVSSRVTSAQAAIRQLRALLRRAGSVSELLAVQDEINTQESALEALLAQQRALGHETSDATVSLLLVGHHARIVAHHKKARHGFVSGLSAGWRALRAVVTGLLTAVGAALPFLVPVALLGGIGYAGRRRLARRQRPAAGAPPAATP
jgi:Domain of unknown function (DUF4349)